MSIICLICKDKLLNNAPGSPIGSLNSLIENQVIATGCGHLYHHECLTCWFRTQKKKKLQNQGATAILTDYCPTCQVEVSEEQIRRVYLLEDHREALEKAKFLERLENLEIYCHQLEINNKQLHRENDLLLNKALTPTSSSLGKVGALSEDFAAIVKNDRVVWLKKDNPPLAGVVLSIFKKDGGLWVKLKLDKKIRTNQRSGLFGSFRFDKRQEMTVPFQEIVLEKDFKKNNAIDENNATSEPSTPTLFIPLQKVPSFRSSTLSLPGDYMGDNFTPMRQGGGLQPILSYDFINNFESNVELSTRTITKSLAYSEKEFESNHVNDSQLVEAASQAHTENLNCGEEKPSENRDYVILNSNSTHYQSLSSGKINNEGRTTPQDGKGKHVTFADDLKNDSVTPTSPKVTKSNHFRDHDYRNLVEISDLDKLPLSTQVSITVTEHEQTDETTSKIISAKQTAMEIPSIKLIEPSVSSTPCSSSLSIPAEVQMETFIDPFENPGRLINAGKDFNSSCFDITFTALFYKCDAFDRLLLFRSASHDQIQQSVQQILSNGFVNPLRNPTVQKYTVGYSNKLYETITHLCSSYLDLEELMTILFEYVFKIPPFISYSYDMCDYIHQFFIDFTDKEKKPTVQQLFEQSLALQDNLKLRAEPSPALILQMPNSEDGIIHYEAILPNLTLNITHGLENADESVSSQGLTCYCNKTATLECSRCAEIHGKSPVLFCEDCSVLLEAIHDEMYHRLVLCPIKPSIPAIKLELAAVICLKSEMYSAFLRNTNSEEEQSNRWVFIDEFSNGEPQFETLPGMEEWVKSITAADASALSFEEMTRLQRRLLTECRMFLYVPKHNSYA